MHEPSTSRDWLIDEIEPLDDESRIELVRRLLHVMDCAVLFILDANCSPTAVWGVAYALEVQSALRQPQAKIAKSLHITRAAISKQAKLFQNILTLEPGHIQKSAKACASYRKEREQQLQ